MQIVEFMVETEGDKDVGIFPSSNRVTIIFHDSEVDGDEFNDLKEYFANFFDGKCTTFEEAMKAYIIESLEEEKMYQEMKENETEDDTRL